MTMRRISALLLVFVSLGAVAAETTLPSPPVSDPDAGSTTPAITKPPADVPKAPPVKPPPQAASGEKTKDGDFKPSEQISEDMSVAYPVDI